ncbi:spore germination protein [Paenibacillus sp. sptzw28]|nr:spore germination protein [Paenibacillus sp. sptzw28]
MPQQSIRLSTQDDLDQFAGALRLALGSMPDLVIRKVGTSQVIYISGIVDQKRIEREIIEPLLSSPSPESGALPVTSPSVELTDDIQTALEALLSGEAAVAVCGFGRVMLVNVASAPHRAVSEPATENAIHGPREGFTEDLDINVGILRRILRSEKLRMKAWEVGTSAKTEVRMVYMEGIADSKLVEEMTARIDAVKLEALIETNYLAENIKDRPLSLFPTIQTTERPDIVHAALMKGKVAIMVDNSPFVLIVPFTFWNAFQANEDYYLMYSSATFVRAIRAFFIIWALTLPSLYVALTTFHIEMLPTNLLLAIAASRERAPFPAMLEALIMESVFEALREAIVRLPRILSQAVSVVGALVIGQAIVQAGVVSIPMVIVVSVTGIASLMIPRYEMTFAIRILRLALLLLAGSLGFYGIALGLFFTQVYLTGVRSAGTPYMTPVAPLLLSGMKDFLIRKQFGRK